MEPVNTAFAGVFTRQFWTLGQFFGNLNLVYRCVRWLKCVRIEELCEVDVIVVLLLLDLVTSSVALLIVMSAMWVLLSSAFDIHTHTSWVDASWVEGCWGACVDGWGRGMSTEIITVVGLRCGKMLCSHLPTSVCVTDLMWICNNLLQLMN